MTAGAPTQSEEWRAHWPLVLAALVGFSFNSVVNYSTGLFMEPLNQEFGWSRAQISMGLTLSTFIAVLLSPVVGLLIDKWGTRLLAIPGLVLAAMALSSFGLANGSITQWLALWTIFALVELAIKSTVWTVAVSGVFTAGRGLALAVMLCGSALAQVITPPLTQWLIEAVGWRMTYVWLGAGWGGIALLLSVLFLFDVRDHDRRAARLPDAVKAAALGGLTLRQAMRDPILLRIAFACFLSMLVGLALIVHEVPILTDAGVTRTNAAYLASLTGVAGVAGKLITGWMMDRWNAGWVGTVCMSASAVACAMLLLPDRTPAIIVTAIVIIGYTTGTKLQICAYMTGRYGGMRNFGAIFGVMSSIVALGSGLGPLAAGLIYDHSGSYALLLILGIPGSLLSGLLIFRLGPYPDWTGSAVPETQPVGSGAMPTPALP